MIVVRIGLACLSLLVLPSLAVAAHSGSMEDQMACTPDVYRLCAGQIPDEDAIVSCLKQNRASLAPACQKVFARPDTPKGNNQSDEETD